MDNKSCLVKEGIFADDNFSPTVQQYSELCIFNDNSHYDSENPPDQIDSSSISSKGSTSNLKIDAPEFVPFQKLKDEVLKSDNTTGISNNNELDAEFKNDVLFLLENIVKDLKTGFSSINQNQGDLLFKSEDRVNFLQKMFLDEINKEKQKLEEQKIINIQLEAKLENLSEILAKTTTEKEEQIKQNVLLQNCLEKQLHIMNTFQRDILTDCQGRCRYIKNKLQEIVPYITCSVPWCKDFQTNLQTWTNHEILLTKHLASVESNLKLLKIVDYNKLDNLPNCDFPFSEPKNILNDVCLYVIQSYNHLYHNNYQSNHVPQSYDNYLCYQQPAVIEGAPVYYTNGQLSGSNTQNNSHSQYQHNQIATNNTHNRQKAFNSEKKTGEDDNCLSKHKTPLDISFKKTLNNPEERDKPISNLAFTSTPNTSQPSSIPNKNSVIPKLELPSPSNLQSTSHNKKSTAKEPLLSDLIQRDCVETDRATQGTSEAHFDDLDNTFSEIEKKKDKNEEKFYDASLDNEEQMKNLSASVKAVGGMNFLHLFLYLWENIPYVTEETLLQAILSVKKTVGKFTGMKKESILISVKRILEPEAENPGIPTVLTEICTICYENFNGSKTLRLKCSHTFHYSCGSKWLLNNNVCPICRYCVLSEDDLQ